MKKLLLLPFLLIALLSCKHRPVEAVKMSEIRFPPPVAKPDEEVKDKDINVNEAVGNASARDVKADPAANGYVNNGNPGIVRDTAKKIIKQGDISFETGDLKQTRAAIIKSLNSKGGYVSEENESNNSEESRKEYVLKVRVPAKYFDSFLNDVSATAVQIDSKNISISDVTTRYIDMSTRLQNKKLLEARYLALLQKATLMGDILEVENKLTEIRSEIESEQGQLNYLGRQVAYSSLDITFYTKHIEPADKGYGAGYKFKKALADGWDMLEGWFYGFIGIWPLLVVIAVVVFLFKRWRKRRKVINA